jgi:lactate permease
MYWWPDKPEHRQLLDPLQDLGLFWSPLWSTLFAALPVLVLFYLLVLRRWLASKAGAAAAAAALVVAVLVFRVRPEMAGMAFLHGAAFGLLPVGWTIFSAMLLYNITVQTGKFDIVRRSVAGLSGDARIQAILIGFAFGAFLEGAAGGGTPVAICGAILVGLGFKPFQAAVICLIANTSPVAYGGLGTPIITLAGVTGLSGDTLSVMAGRQLPFVSLFVPLYMVRCMCGWRQTWEVWPALLVSGGSFAVFQFLFASLHLYGGPTLWPMTDIGGGIFSLVVTAVFLRFWKPKKEWHFDRPPDAERGAPNAAPTPTPTEAPAADRGTRNAEPASTPAEAPAAAPAAAAPPKKLDAANPHAAEAAALVGGEPPPSTAPLTFRSVALAWTPFAIMSVLLLLSGILRQAEGERRRLKEEPIKIGPVQTNYVIEVPLLQEVYRPEALSEVKPGEKQKPEKAEYDFAWLTSPGTPVFLSALISMLLLRMNGKQVAWVFRRTFFQMQVPIPTIAFMLGLSYVTRYAGMDATLGFAFSKTGVLYPFFAAMLGWLGVFLTGTDAGSNALFGSLQKITATQIHHQGAFAASGLSLGQAQVLICTSNSTGGVMGKMIDAQSIVVSTAATNQLGREADIFKAVFWHSILLAALIGLMTLLQAYVVPFTGMVPR